MVLNADDYAGVARVLGAGADIGRDPFFYLITGGAFRYGLPGLRTHLGVGENAEYRRTELPRDFSPFLNALHIVRACSLVGYGEITAHSGAADADPKFESTTLELENILVSRNAGSVFFVTREIVSRRIERVEILLRAKFDKIE